MRLFVAIDVGPPLTGEGPSLYPVHLTLQFLGEVAEDRWPRIASALRFAVTGVPQFELTLAGVGAFPSSHAPRVVWIGVTEGREKVTEIALRVQGSLAATGLPPASSAFVPHVTLFRVRSARDRRRARLLLDGSAEPPPPRTVRVAEIHLKQSVLTPTGPVHRTLESVPLHGSRSPEDQPV